MRAVVFCSPILLTLAGGCNRGKDWCGPCEAEEATLHVTMRFLDDYTEAVHDGKGADMVLILERGDTKDDCGAFHGDDESFYIDRRMTDLDYSHTYQVQEGWVCGSTWGWGATGRDDRGHDYYIDCSGGFDPIRVRECACVEAKLDVICEEVWDEGA